MQVSSRTTTLHALTEDPYLRFTVPIYQRLYVWGDEQVRTMLENVRDAFLKHAGSTYFLGVTLVLERGEGNVRWLELIDGQQRFTTLWLIGAAWPCQPNALTPFLLDGEGQPRLRFEIRPEVNLYLHRLAKREVHSEADEEALATGRLRETVAQVKGFLEQLGHSDLAAFNNYLFDQVEMVLTTVPSGTDLNLLFETINNRGVQLQHHEILKARMLAALHRDAEPSAVNSAAHATIWDACAAMESYVERSLHALVRRGAEGWNPSRMFDPEASAQDRETLADGGAVMQALGLRSVGVGESLLSLDEILGSSEILPTATGDTVSSNNEETELRSTMSFSIFLQHVLRVWRHHRNLTDLPRISDRELISLFEDFFFAESSADDGLRARHVTEFVTLLWELRYLYDKHVIKWLNVEGDTQHRISKLELQEGSSLRRRPDEGQGVRRGFGLLQSMLYHAQPISTQYWLTPLLAYMQQRRTGADDYYRYLRLLENELFCRTEEEGTLAERTFAFMGSEPESKPFAVAQMLRQEQGTGFRRYWFYKLDFVLWYLGPESYLSGTKPDWLTKWREFHFVARNSVEHVAPQIRHELDRAEFDPRMLHRFGNLGLVSRSINSAFGNKPFKEKRAHFESRAQEKLDSLKLALVYENQEWTSPQIQEHEDRMITALETYLNAEERPTAVAS